MRLRHLLGASLLCCASMAGARDIHGVNGYYNWTAAQLQANGNFVSSCVRDCCQMAGR